MICPSSEDFVLYQWRTLTMMGHRIQTGASWRKQQCRWSIKKMYYLDEGGWFFVGCLVNAGMITALGWGWRLNPKSLWARSNDDTWWGLSRIARLDLIGSSAVTIRDYGTIVHKRKLVLEITQGGFPTNRPPRWLALYGYLQKNTDQRTPTSLRTIYLHPDFHNKIA